MVLSGLYSQLPLGFHVLGYWAHCIVPIYECNLIVLILFITPPGFLLVQLIVLNSKTVFITLSVNQLIFRDSAICRSDWVESVDRFRILLQVP